MGRFDIKMRELLSGMATVTSDGSEEMTPAIKAIKLLMPTLLKHLRKADEATIAKFSKMFADGMYWVATGKEIPSDNDAEPTSNAERDSAEEVPAGIDNRGVGVGEIDPIGVSDSPIFDGLSTVEDSGSGHEAEVQGGVDSGGSSGREVVQAVGSRRGARKLDASAVKLRSVEEPA